jgi:hypothetical protein
LKEIELKIAKVESEIAYEKGHLIAEIEALEDKLHGDHHGHGHDEHADDHGHEGSFDAMASARIAEIEHMLASDKLTILTDAAYEAKEDKLYRLQRHRQRIMETRNFTYGEDLSAWDAGMDDQIVKGEFHLPLGREVEFVFRSRDVIHSAYMPHFRTQMNSVPGVPTRFKMTPIISTDSMRIILDNPDFDYVLLCNKVCGASHYNMQMKLVVESEESYEAWLAEQDEFLMKEDSEELEQEKATTEVASETITASL